MNFNFFLKVKQEELIIKQMTSCAKKKKEQYHLNVKYGLHVDVLLYIRMHISRF